MKFRDPIMWAVGAALCLPAAPASAQQQQRVSFGASLINSCILSLDTDGSLGTAPSGTELNSELANGGNSAVVALVAVGAVPRVTFSVPELTTPSGDSGSQGFIKYTSLSGANQGYTQAQTSYRGGLLLDSYTLDARVLNEDGFAAGDYEVVTTLTCGQ